MKVDNLLIDSLFEDSLSDENKDVNKIIDEVFSDNSEKKKTVKIEILGPNGLASNSEKALENQERIEAMLKEAVGSETVERVLSNIEEEEKFSDYIDDAIFMRNQDVDLTGIEGALIRGCRIEKRLTFYRNQSELCKKNCEKLMEYEFFQSLNRMMEEQGEVDIFEENKKIPYIISEEEYLLIKSEIEDFYQERLENLKEEATILNEKSYIIVGENLEGEERILGFIEEEKSALELFDKSTLSNKSLSLAKLEYLEEEESKIILNYEIVEIIK